MGIIVSGSLAMADLMVFNDEITKSARQVDLDGAPAILANIGNRCLTYSSSGRKVDVANHHASIELSFYAGDELILQSVFPMKELSSLVNMSLRWLTQNVISGEPLPVKMNKIPSPIDGKYYDTVDIAVHINSSLETLELYREFTEQGMSYVQDKSGYGYKIGAIGGRPNWIAPLIHVINGVRVLYVEATGVVVDWDAIDVWIKERVKDGTPIVTDPINLRAEINSVIQKRNSGTGVQGGDKS